MTPPATYKLSNVDPEDIDAVLLKIQQSFAVSFDDINLQEITTFGALCDIISDKIPGDDTNDCTTQQAFYKIRKAIADSSLSCKRKLTTATRLQQIFPRNKRRKHVKSMEKSLGFKTKILRPKYWITGTLAILWVISFIMLFLSWKVGLAGLICFTALFKLANMFGKELELQTLGELAEKISREHYIRSRRDSNKVNRPEIKQKIKQLFQYELDLEAAALTRDAAFSETL